MHPLRGIKCRLGYRWVTPANGSFLRMLFLNISGAISNYARETRKLADSSSDEFQAKTITIEEATGPRRSDIRSRYSYIPDRKAEQREINERFPSGLHFIGDWHTHPEQIPHLSGTDLDNMRECVKKSRHAVSGFLLIVVGTDPQPSGLHASLHNGKDTLLLRMEDASVPTDRDATST